MIRLCAVAAALSSLFACGKPGPPPAAAADPVPLDGVHRKLQDLDAKYLHYAIGDTIDAPPDVVWSVLSDVPAWSSWNRTIVSTEGEAVVGQQVKLVARIAPDRTFKLTVAELVPEQRMVWEDGNNMFKGVRTYTLSPAGDGTAFTMKEAYTGHMLKMIVGKLPDFGPEFEAFAADLAAESENRHQAAGG